MKIHCPNCASTQCVFRVKTKRYSCSSCSEFFTYDTAVKAQKARETPKPVKAKYKGEKAGHWYLPDEQRELHRNLFELRDLAMMVRK